MNRRLLGLFAHPDDESRIVGGVLAKYASEGAKVSLVVATRGEAGSCGEPPLCTLEDLPRVRERELREACAVLGVTDLTILEYRDGTLATVDRSKFIGHLVAAIRRVRPHIILTFGPEGRTLHPDHIVIHEAATAAFSLAADPGAYPELRQFPHATPKLYYTTFPQSLVDAIQWSFPGQPDNEITIALDIRPWIGQKKRATNEAHRTQAHDQPFANLPEDERWRALSTEYFFLAATQGIARSNQEDDLFDGIEA
ncbi:MAG: PIG-L family deacetylase [Chloroflexia bacterium]|nr:PIG-L family deacetylase [Chloroflexia bacterium]